MTWQTLETAPRDRVVLWWIVPKSAHEAYRDTSGRAIVSTFAPYLAMGRMSCWSGLAKATYWMPLPDPPTAKETP